MGSFRGFHDYVVRFIVWFILEKGDLRWLEKVKGDDLTWTIDENINKFVVLSFCEISRNKNSRLCLCINFLLLSKNRTFQKWQFFTDIFSVSLRPTNQKENR